MNDGICGGPPPRPQRPPPRDNLYARTLTRHALLQSSLSLPLPPPRPLAPPSRPIERSPPFLSRSSNSLDILPPRHRPLFAAAAGSALYSSSLALNEADAPDGACAHYHFHYFHHQREPARLKRRCDSTSSLGRPKPKRDANINNNEWGRKLSK